MTDARTRGLAPATRLFWKNGTRDSSYGDIVAATGLSRKALYGTWPDKRSLIRATLLHYEAQVLVPRLARLSPPGAAALAAFWSALETEASGRGWCGCYLFRTVSETGRGDAELTALYDSHVSDLHAALGAAIEAAAAASDAAEVDANAAAWAAVALILQASTLGALSGHDARISEIYRAGRVICGLAPG